MSGGWGARQRGVGHVDVMYGRSSESDLGGGPVGGGSPRVARVVSDTGVDHHGPAKVVANPTTTSWAVANSAATRMPTTTRGCPLIFTASSMVMHRSYRLHVVYRGSSYYITGARGIWISVTQP